MNMAGKGSWTPLATSTVVELGSSTDFYSTTFSKTSSSGATFSLTAHVSRGAVNTFESIPCSNCSSGSGPCIDPYWTCSAFSNPPPSGAPPGDGACDVNATACTVPVTLPRDALKFSITVAGWTFKDASNKLGYSIVLKEKGVDVAATNQVNVDGSGDGSGDVPSVPQVSKVGKTTRIKNPDGTIIDMPGEGKLAGGPDGEQDVDVDISIEASGSSLVINFVFPNVPEGRTFYYDPTVDTTTPNESENGRATGGAGDMRSSTTTTGTKDGVPNDNSATSIVGPLWAASAAITAAATGLVAMC